MKINFIWKHKTLEGWDSDIDQYSIQIKKPNIIAGINFYFDDNGKRKCSWFFEKVVFGNENLLEFDDTIYKEYSWTEKNKEAILLKMKKIIEKTINDLFLSYILCIEETIICIKKESAQLKLETEKAEKLLKQIRKFTNDKEIKK